MTPDVGFGYGPLGPRAFESHPATPRVGAADLQESPENSSSEDLADLGTCIQTGCLRVRPMLQNPCLECSCLRYTAMHSVEPTSTMLQFAVLVCPLSKLNDKKCSMLLI